MCAIAVHRYEAEAQERQAEGNIHGGPTDNGAKVDNHALQRRHQGSAHDGHNEEGCTKCGVFSFHIFQCYTIDGREHDGHKEADKNQAVKTCLAIDANGSKGKGCRTDAKNHEQTSGIDVAHDECANEAAAEVQRHSCDIEDLRCSLVDAKTVGILDDEGPTHNLSCHIEDLCQHTVAICGVKPEAAQGVAGIEFSSVTGHIGHLGQTDNDKHHQHDKADYHVWVANNSQVMQSDICLFCLGE